MTSTQDLVLVTGASGKTGRRCIAHLTARGARIRTLVRRDTAANELLAAGVAEAVVGDLFDPAVLLDCCAGVTQVLHICPAMHPQEDALAEMLIAAAKSARVRQFVLWSVLHPHADVPHHRRKQRAEAALIDSGLCFTILQPGRYMQHLETIWDSVRSLGLHSFPFSVSTPFSLAHLDDLAQVAALVLTQPGHDNAIYELAGPEALSQADCAAILADVLDRYVTARAAPLDQALAKARSAGIPDWRIETLAIMNRHYDAHGLAGNPNVLRWLLGREPTSFRAYVRALAAA